MTLALRKRIRRHKLDQPGQNVDFYINLHDQKREDPVYRYPLAHFQEEPRKVIHELAHAELEALKNIETSLQRAQRAQNAERPYRWLYRIFPDRIVNEQVADEVERLSNLAEDERPSPWSRFWRRIWICGLVVRETLREKTKDAARGLLTGRRQ